MAYVLIDSDNYQAAGIETLFFPGGEPHAKIPDTLRGDVLLFLKLRTWNDVGVAACVVDALSRNVKIEEIKVFIPYWPGARQDRSNGLAPVTKILVQRLFDNYRAQIHVFDIHSYNAFVPICKNWMPEDLAFSKHISSQIVGIIAPDEGATERARRFQKTFYPGTEFIQCSKSRDSVTGKLHGYTIDTPLKLKGGYIIVDDICDGGGTFNLLAKAFDQQEGWQGRFLELFVSHGIFSKGLHAISPRISKIYTTNSWYRSTVDPINIGWNRVTCLPLEQLFSKILGEK